MATINRMHSVHYRVKVPDNVGPGELFNATLGSANKTYTLRCPEGVRSGSMVDVAVSSNPDGTESVI